MASRKDNPSWNQSPRRSRRIYRRGQRSSSPLRSSDRVSASPSTSVAPVRQESFVKWFMDHDTVCMRTKNGSVYTHPFLTEVAMQAVFGWMAQKPPALPYSWMSREAQLV